MNRLIILLPLLFVANFTQAQFQYIPSSTQAVMSFDMSRLGKKMDLNKISGFKMLKSKDSLEYGYMKELVARIIGNLSESGVDVKQKLVTYTRKDSMNATAYLIPLASSKKMLSIMEKFNKNILFESDKLHISKDKNVTYFISAKNRLGVAVYNDLCFVLEGPYEYYYREDEYVYDHALDSMRSRIDSIRGLNPQVIEGGTDNVVPPADDESPDTTAVNSGEDDYVEAPSEYNEWNYDDDSLMIAFRQWWEKKRQKEEDKWWLTKEQKYKNYISANYNLAKTKKGSYYTDNKFNQNASIPSDIFQWVDFTPYIKEITKSAQCRSYYNDSGNYTVYCDSTPENETEIGKFLGTLFLSGHGDFNNGNANMNYDMRMSDSIQKYFNQMLGENVNKKLFDVIKVPQVASLTSKNIRFPAMMELYFAGADQYRQTYNRNKENNRATNKFQQAALASFEMFYLMLDKDMLYNTINGSAISAITGILKTRESYTSWEYDEEGNYKSVTKYADREYPKFVSVFEIGNDQNLDKLMAPLLRNDLLHKSGNTYRFNAKNVDFLNYFFVRTNGLLLFTNDSLYNNPDYLNMPPAMDAAYVDNIASKPFYLELNGQGTRNLLRGMSQMSPSMRDQSSAALDAINKVTFTTTNSINNFNINVDFTNKTRCSFIDILEMIDLLYK